MPGGAWNPTFHCLPCSDFYQECNRPNLSVTKLPIRRSDPFRLALSSLFAPWQRTRPFPAPRLQIISPAGPRTCCCIPLQRPSCRPETCISRELGTRHGLNKYHKSGSVLPRLVLGVGDPWMSRLEHVTDRYHERI